MKWISAAVLILIVSCGQNSKNKEITPDSITTDKPIPPPPISEGTTLMDHVSDILKKEQPAWIIVNDSIASWPKDVFDYFIGPKRKDQSYYPYIARSDFDADSTEDAAVLVTQPGSKKYAIAIIRDLNSTKPPIDFWKEDIDVTALSVYPKETLHGLDGKKATMKAEGIAVEYYEKSSFVIYWDGKGWKRIWTGD